MSRRPEQRNVPVSDSRKIQMSKYKGSNPGAVNDLASIMRSQQLNYNNGPNRPRAIDVIEKDGGDLQLP